MEVVNKKDGNKNYMIIKDVVIDENDYKYKMIKNNNIENIVPITIRMMDGEKYWHYNVTEYVSMRTMYARKKISGKDLYNLIKDIKKIAEVAKEYLIDLNDFLFDIDYVYINKQSGKYSFCYCPGVCDDVQQNMRTLFDQILEYIDHNNKSAVLIAYGIQQITISDSYTVGDLYNCAKENLSGFEEENRINQNMVVEAKKNTVQQPYEDKKKNPLKKIVERFIKKSKYLDEDELMSSTGKEKTMFTSPLKDKDSEEYYCDNSIQYINDGDDDVYNPECEEATMLLTSTGAINKITLKEISEQGNMEIEPNEYPCILGKSKLSSDYVVDSPVVSRVHLRISEEMSNYYVEDLNSTNGTFVNGKRLEPHKLEEINVGDLITVANLDFIVE